MTTTKELDIKVKKARYAFSQFIIKSDEEYLAYKAIKDMQPTFYADTFVGDDSLYKDKIWKIKK